MRRDSHPAGRRERQNGRCAGRGIFHGSPHSPQRDEMFTAQKQGQLAIPQDLCRAGFNIHQSAFAGAEAELQISAVKHVAVGQVFILIGAVGFQAIAFVADGGRAKACAGAVAGGGIERAPYSTMPAVR